MSINKLMPSSKYIDNFIARIPRQLSEVILAVTVGGLAGLLLIYSWRLSFQWQGLLLVFPIGIVLVLFVNDLQKFILAVISVGVPLNLDISLIISPYARNPENLARGHRTLIALTELRLSIVTILVLVGYALWLISSRNSVTRRSVKFFPATTIPALGLIFFSLLSIFQSTDIQLAFFRSIQLIELFLIYFYLANHLRTKEDFRFFLLVSISALFIESTVIIWQAITGISFEIAGIEAYMLGPGRIGGTIGHTGPAAGYLTALGIISLAMIWAFEKPSYKIFSIVTIGLTIIALINTGSRIGWGAFALTVGIFIFIGLKKLWLNHLTMIITVFIILAFGALFYDTIYNRYTADDNGSAEARPMMYRMAWNMIREHPWLGVGVGNYALVTQNYYTPDVGEAKEVIDIQVHNRYLLIWAESGIFALLCYLSFLGAGIIKAGLCIKSKLPFVALLGTGIMLAIISLSIQMLTGTFHVRPITAFVWMLPALAVALERYLLEETSQLALEHVGQNHTDTPFL